MTLGDVKIEALKLMFTNVEDDLFPKKLSNYIEDENYRDYLVNMPGAINRCFARLSEVGVLPSRRHALARENALASASFVRYDLSAIPDFYDVERLIREDVYGDYEPDADYYREGDMLVLPRYEEGDGISYTLIYKPRLMPISSITSNETVLDIPDDIAVLIPYFIKGDLYRIDEPNEAAEARNWFESAIGEMLLRKTDKVNGIKSVYSLSEV